MNITEDAVQAAIIDAKYEGYLTKQERLVANLRTLENKKIPSDLDYKSVTHLRTEAKEKLASDGWRVEVKGSYSPDRRLRVVRQRVCQERTVELVAAAQPELNPDPSESA
jgi:predicted ABC-type transport system involved in lysophospholipase L1 biosynthesis ATPase subunit